MRKSVVTLLVPALLVGSLLGPVHAGKAKKKKPPVEFAATGSITLAHPLDLEEVGVTRSEFERDCAVPTTTQGLDGYVIELPPHVTAVSSRVWVEGSSPSGVSVLDLFFFGPACEDYGRILASDDYAIMPEGTKFVLVTNWFGDPADFHFTATEVR